jgi:glycosyltransferase involved in cell wall biosynthesis
MSKLSVIIPALNEENGIAEIAQRVLSIAPQLSAMGVDGPELIIVDDGSTDKTPQIVADMPGVRLIRHEVNRGYGAAIKTGFYHATGDLLAFLDADGTYPPEYYPALCRPILEGNADLVIGSRMAGADSEMPLVRRIGNTIFATLVSIISNRHVTDSASGQRVLRSQTLPQLYPLPDGLNFTPVMSTRAMHEQINVVEVPITYSERVGRSKLSVVRDGVRFLNSILMTALTYNPVRIFGLVGMAFILLGLVVGVSAFILPGISARQDGLFALVFAGLVLASVGVNIFSIGATFNYIVSLFHKRRIRQGLIGRPLFRRPLEFCFGWLGIIAMMGGLLVYGLAIWFNWTAQSNPAPWFAPAVSTVMVLTGVQLLTSWLLVLVLAELSARDTKAEIDLEPVLSFGSGEQTGSSTEKVRPLASLTSQ